VCFEEIHGWQSKSCPYLCDLGIGPIILVKWALAASTKGLLDPAKLQQAIDHLQEADVYAPIHISLFNKKTLETLEIERAVGWQVITHHAIGANRDCLQSLMDCYLGDELSDHQPRFGLVDWLRSCLMVVIACPQLQSWTVQEREMEGVPAAMLPRAVAVSQTDTATREQGGEVFLWARDFVWDLATVLGQMPVCRQGKYGKSASSAMMPSEERDRIRDLVLQREQDHRGHDDLVRHDDMRVEARQVACRWLGSLVAQRVKSMARLLAEGRVEGLRAVKKRRERGSQGGLLSRLNGRTHWGGKDVAVDWHDSCTEDMVPNIREPALYMWVQAARCASSKPITTLGPTLLVAAPGPSTTAPQLHSSSSSSARGAVVDTRWVTVSEDVMKYKGVFDVATSVTWSQGQVITEVVDEPTVLPWETDRHKRGAKSTSVAHGWNHSSTVRAWIQCFCPLVCTWLFAAARHVGTSYYDDATSHH
jgi:hypothetical protein